MARILLVDEEYLLDCDERPQSFIDIECFCTNGSTTSLTVHGNGTTMTGHCVRRETDGVHAAESAKDEVQLPFQVS